MLLRDSVYVLLTQSEIDQVNLRCVLVTNEYIFQLDVIVHPAQGMEVSHSLDLYGTWS